VATGAVVVAGAFSVPSPAATVNGVSISRTDLNDQLNTISENAVFGCYLQASVAVRSSSLASLPPVSGSGSETFNTAFVDFWLEQQINNLLVEQLAARQHLSIDANALAAGREDLANSISSTLGAAAANSGQSAVCAPDGASVVSSLPAGLADQLVRAQAAGDLVLANAAGYGLSTSELSRYFGGHRSQFDTICLSAIQVASQASATSLRSAIVAGEDFASAAMANSTDSASAANGGAIGCYAATDSAYTTVTSDVKGLNVGEVSQPIANSSSYLLLMVTSRQPAVFDAVVPAVRQAVLAAGSKQAASDLTQFTKSASVSVDPRYGRWSTESGVGIRPPIGPSATNLLNPSQ
jgi:parvulin-like peptidyl-prolyl isomerase